MKIEDVKTNAKPRKTINISVRTFPKYSKFMKEHTISPTALFNKAVEELMEKK